MEARALRLTVRSGPQAGTSLGLPDEGIVRIGSSRACQLVLQGERIVKIHCFLRCSGGRCLLVVHDKKAAVLVNGEDARKKFLAPGNALEMGGVSLALEVFREDPLVGATLGGYRIEKLLGQGSMGHVYQATQLSLQRQVALKVLSPELTKDESFVQEFLKEARAAARLDHPNVVQVIDAAQEGGAFFFSMEFLPGGTVARWLEEKGSLSLEAALRVACDTARALAWAQEKGIVHRDIKPDNLLLAADGTVKVADLGIAADILSASREEAGRPVGIGSPRYMAPEQALRKPVDHRADIYSLGCTLYRMVAGRAPFEGKTAAEIVRAKTTREAIPLARVARGVPSELSAVVQAMLARDPEKRPPNSSEVLARLEACLAAVEEEKRRAVASGRRARPTRRAAAASSWISACWMSRSGKLALAASGFFVLLALIFFLSGRHPRSTPDAGKEGPGPETRLAQVAPQPPESVQGEKEKGAPEGPSGPSPEAVALDMTNDPAEIAAGKELGGIVTASGSSPLDDRRRLADLEAFKRKHPEPRWTERADRVIARIREGLRAKGAAALGKVAAELAPLLRASEFNEATRKLLDLKEEYPESHEEIEGEIRKVAGAAAVHWKALQDRAAGLVGAADFTGAAALLVDLDKKYPPGLHGEVERKAAEIARGEKEHAQASRTIDEALAKVRAALSTLDFDAAASLAVGIPDFESPPLARRKESLSSDVGRSKAAWEKLRAGLSAAQRGGKAVTVAFEPEPARTEGSYRITAIEGGVLKVQKEGSSRVESRPVFALDARSLVGLLAAGSGQKPQEGGPPSELREGLGLLLLHVEGPARAKEILGDESLGAEKVELYQARVDSETPAFLSSLLARETARVERLSAAAAAGGFTPSPELSAEAEGLSARIGRTIALHRAMAGYERFKHELAWLFLQARAVALRPSAPQCLFQGKVASFKPDGTVELVYDFQADAELKDFVKIHRDTRMEMDARDKNVTILGEIRLGRGDLFKDKLSVTARIPSSGYTVNAPNINVALWTRDGDEITARSGGSESESDRPAEPSGAGFLVFGIGYKARAYGEDYLIPRDAEQTILMPANALFLGTRGMPLHSSPARDDCLWAARFRPQGVARQVVLIEVTPDSFPRWTLNGSRVIPDPSARKLVAGAVRRREGSVGSVTLFTNGETLKLDSLSVAGELNPAWLEVALLRRAEDDLKEIEPEFPFQGKVRWSDLAECHLELRSLREDLARAPRAGGERECLSLLQIVAATIAQAKGAPAALLSRVREQAMEAASSIAPGNVEHWTEVAQITLFAGDVEGAYRLLEKKARSARSGDTEVGARRLSRLRRLLLRETGSYASIDANLAAPEAIVPEGATWRYFPGRSPPSEGLEWTRVNFDDGEWKEGASGFGYGDDDLETVLGDMRDEYTTLYVRRKFQIPSPRPWTGLILTVTADDGFVAYLSGVEVGRERAPGLPWTQVKFSDRATDWAPEPEPTKEIHLDPKHILPGDNVLAIQGLNLKDSGDFILTPCLLGETPPGPEHDRRRFRDLLSRGQEGTKNPAPAHLRSYLEGRLLQRAGEHGAAASEFRKVLQADRSSAEPFLRLAESLRGSGDARGAEAILLEALASGVEASDPLWDSWFAVCAVDRKRGIPDLLGTFPRLPEDAPEVRGHDIRWVLESLAKGGAVRLNSGGDEHRSTDGRLWGQDRFHFGVSYRYFGDRQGGAKEPFEGDIFGTDDDLLYQTERWFALSNQAPPGYRIPLPPSRYRVTLHFAEIFFKPPEKRAFHVELEGKRVLTDYNPAVNGFATPDRRVFEPDVADGFLDIAFIPQEREAKISAIEVEILR